MTSKAVKKFKIRFFLRLYDISFTFCQRYEVNTIEYNYNNRKISQLYKYVIEIRCAKGYLSLVVCQ